MAVTVAEGGVFVADRNINTLIDFRYARKHHAKNGEKGRGADCYGAGGPDIDLRVPVGTVITDAETGEKLVDMIAHGQRELFGARRTWRHRQSAFQIKHQSHPAAIYERRAG